MSDTLRVEGVTHTYQPGRPVLDDVSLEVVKGEVLTLLGPSGCGKTTLLRIVAGFLKPSQGRVFLHGEDVTAVPPHRRRVNLVFQRAALFPHLDVYDNLCFGLRLAKVSKDEIATRVREALALVRLEGFAHRPPGELSGGQAQRVALARALINRPEVLLMDEPLSALDLRIRLEMEVELRRVHRETGATFVYVTHDQHEALSLSDRIAVFDQGRIAQLASPREIYHHPNSPLTARFVGDANVIPAEVAGGGERIAVQVAGSSWSVPSALGAGLDGSAAWLVVRQEDVVLGPAGSGGGPGMSGVVRDIGFRGAGYAYQVEVAGLSHPVKAERATAAGGPYAVGTQVSVGWDPGAVRLLPRQPGQEPVWAGSSDQVSR
ncbi:MAG: ABC transporter ATP-binding protein [Solirubrobacterales bacterium]